ncbi:MAG: DUF6443 domain-containing protein, partial [Sediminibacterium sp.]
MRKHLVYLMSFCFLLFSGLFAQNKPGVGAIPSGTAVAMPGAYPSGVKVNYIRTRKALSPITDTAVFRTSGYGQVGEATQYIDGLGRPLQIVQKQATPLLKDLVSATVYDEFGREQYKYLPYASTEETGAFKLTPFVQQQGFMQTQYSGEQVFYSQTQYEPSPLSRVTKIMGAGNSWAGSGRGVETEYRFNDIDDQVRVWTIGNGENDIPYTNAVYGVGELHEQHTIDEHSKKVVEYKDKDGKVVLKKVQISDAPSEHYTGWLCTFYVYDDLGLLRFVIPPKATVELAVNNWSFTAEQVNELSFRYYYDGRNRMIAKKVPGAGWVYMVYDRRDRLTYTQDANMRNQGKWIVSLYDNLNRPTTTGIVTYSGTRDQLQALLDTRFDAAVSTSTTVNFTAPDILYVNERQAGKPVYRAVNEIQFTGEFTSEPDGNFETILAPAVVNTQTVLQNYNPFPDGANFIALTLNSYDDYTAASKQYSTADNSKLGAGNNAYPESLPSSASVLTKALPTVVKTRVIEKINDLSAGNWLETVMYYDDKGRVIQTQSENYKNGTDIVTTRYDFTDRPISVYQLHNNPAGAEVARTKTDMEYDFAGRLLNIKKTLNDNSATTRYIVRNEYDELGQLKNRQLGQYANNSNPLENLQYNYNIRGWLSGVNKDYATGGPSRWFGTELSYDWGFEENQFNGNIAGVKWRSKGDGEQRAFGYGYDPSNRIIKADFTQNTGGAWNKSAGLDFSMKMGDGQNPYTAYDANGNILGMQQWGWKTGGSVQIDSLGYDYTGSSNKLKSVYDAFNDPGTKLGDFRTSGTSSNIYATSAAAKTDYGYDANGNLIEDKNKDIASISYNHLNLPYEITVTGKGTIRYIY